ncbi:hypothetical protein [Nonomuraea typhae]|uniref:Transcriptional regulator n=1 Tax=Nonomuraea typhae TaxID=2603600 RepID=A0ABW7YM29_9ACTN
MKHVATLTAAKLMFLAALMLFAGLSAHPLALALGLTVDAASHYWADRRFTLARFADLVGKGDFYRLGLPEAAPAGVGSYALDQSWHHLWIFVAALIIAA